MHHDGKPTWRIECRRYNFCYRRLNGDTFQGETTRLTAHREGSHRASSSDIGCGGRDPLGSKKTKTAGQSPVNRRSTTSCPKESYRAQRRRDCVGARASPLVLFAAATPQGDSLVLTMAPSSDPQVAFQRCITDAPAGRAG
ncbi:unnamed protein product [Lasius platythorax]|uniref:Uncharacterized protein n=1 Tax=Lasius platythorax TaxID=488582 RepID=A0AAV2MX07_9HYME